MDNRTLAIAIRYDAYKRSARRANRDATIRTHSEELKLVRQQNNDASVTQSFSNRFVDSDIAITARPASVARQDIGTQTSDSDGEDPGAQADEERYNEMLTNTQAGRKRKKKTAIRHHQAIDAEHADMCTLCQNGKSIISFH